MITRAVSLRIGPVPVSACPFCLDDAAKAMHVRLPWPFASPPNSLGGGIGHGACIRLHPHCSSTRPKDLQDVGMSSMKEALRAVLEQ